MPNQPKGSHKGSQKGSQAARCLPMCLPIRISCLPLCLLSPGPERKPWKEARKEDTWENILPSFPCDAFLCAFLSCHPFMPSFKGRHGKEATKKARKDLDEGVKKSAASAQAALDASKMKPPSRASKGALAEAGATKKNLKKYTWEPPYDNRWGNVIFLGVFLRHNYV